MSSVLRSGYAHYVGLDDAQETPIRHMIYKSIANMVPVVIMTDREDLLGSNFGLAVTFGAPDPDMRFNSFVTRMQVIKDMPGDQEYPLKQLQDSIELEKAFDIDGIIAGFKQAQDKLAENAVLVSVSALFGLTRPIAIDEGSGVLVVTHTPNGNNGLTLIDQYSEILKAQRLPQSKVFNINGNDYDLTGDLAVMYDVLTTRDDELLAF